MTPSAWLAERLARIAAGRLRPRYPDWAEALLHEQLSLSGRTDQLGWAIGALRASFALRAPDLLYPFALLLAVLAMALYQWSADESLMTVMVLAVLGLGLGFFCDPRDLSFQVWPWALLWRS